MELQNIYLEALKDRYKANATVKAIEEKIKETAEGMAFEKYKTVILANDGMEYELGGVRASFYTDENYVSPPLVDLRLAYFCKSKLPKKKREKLEQVKLKYKKGESLEWCYYAVPAWKALGYSVSVKDILFNNINLCIE